MFQNTMVRRGPQHNNMNGYRQQRLSILKDGRPKHLYDLNNMLTPDGYPTFTPWFVEHLRREGVKKLDFLGEMFRGEGGGSIPPPAKKIDFYFRQTVKDIQPALKTHFYKNNFSLLSPVFRF